MSRPRFISGVWRGAETLGELLGRCLGDRRGATAMLYGLMLFPLMAFTGVAVDLARAYIVRAQLQQAMDAALLAAIHDVNQATPDPNYTGNITGTAATSPTPSTTRDTTFNAYFRTNFSGDDLGVTHVTYSLTYTAQTLTNPPTLTANASATMPTVFMRVFGQDTVDVATSGTVYASVRGMELVMALDITGSMWDNSLSYPGYGTVHRLEALKYAATELVNIVYGCTTSAGLSDCTINSVNNLFVGLVPFGTAVNINHPLLTSTDLTVQNNNLGLVRPAMNPAVALTTPRTQGSGSVSNYNLYYPYPNDRSAFLVTPSSVSNTTAPFNAEPWSGCVLSRGSGSGTSGLDTTETPPTSSATRFQPFNYPQTPLSLPDGSGNPYFDDSSCTNSSNSRLRTCSSTYTIAYDNPYGRVSSNAYRIALGSWVLSAAGWTNTVSCRSGTYNALCEEMYWGPNRTCPVNAVVPLIRDRRRILQAIANLYDIGNAGGTMTNMGMVWAWRAISPQWRTFWYDGIGAPSDEFSGNWGVWVDQGVTYRLPLDYATGTQPHPNMDKVVIIFTDGDNNVGTTPYTPYGRAFLNSGRPTLTDLNNKMSVICTNMRNQGILIYAVILQDPTGGASATGVSLLQDCVGSDHQDRFFAVTTGDQLQTAFRAIGGQLSRIRLGR